MLTVTAGMDKMDANIPFSLFHTGTYGLNQRASNVLMQLLTAHPPQFVLASNNRSKASSPTLPSLLRLGDISPPFCSTAQRMHTPATLSQKNGLTAKSLETTYSNLRSFRGSEILERTSGFKPYE